MELQTSDGQPYRVRPEGSLGVLALGYRGVMAWRQARRDATAAGPAPTSDLPTAIDAPPRHARPDAPAPLSESPTDDCP